MSNPAHLKLLTKWIRHADTIIGQNIAFDILYLRAFSPVLRTLLDGRHTLIDLMVVNYLHNEVRPERSLKNLGPVLGTHVYEKTLASGVESWADLHQYNAEDTHNTLLATAELARRISLDFPETSKLSPFCIQFYSDTIWSCLKMTEAGVPIDRDALHALYLRLSTITRTATRCAKRRCGLKLGGTGSKLTQTSFLNETIDEINKGLTEVYLDELLKIRPDLAFLGPWKTLSRESLRQKLAFYDEELPDILNDPMLVLTPKRREVSFNDENRQLLRGKLPADHPSQAVFDMISQFKYAQKLTGSYCYPLLWHRIHHPDKRGSVLIPQQGVPTCSSSVSAPNLPKMKTTSSSTSKKSTNSSRVVTSPPSSSLEEGTETSPKSKAPSKRQSTRSGTRSTGSISREPRVWLSHPTWYVVPSPIKDGKGASGGTQQGRIVCKGAAHQTDPPEVQECRCSRWIGGCLCGFDLSQIELRVAGLLSGDRTLIDNYQRGDDLHAARAITAFGLDFLSTKYGVGFAGVYGFKKDRRGERQTAKHVNFADLFRAGAATMQATVLEKSGILMPLEFFEEIVRSRARVRPGLWAWQEELIHHAHSRKHIVLPLTGQSRMFEGGEKYDVNEIVNFPVQTTAGNTLLRIQNQISRALQGNPSILLYLNVYDALYFDVQSPSLVPELEATIETAVRYVEREEYWAWLQDLYGCEVPIEYEFSQGKAA